METKPKTVDDSSWGEVGGLLHDCVVQPLTTELEKRLNETSKKEEGQLDVISESLKNVQDSAMRLEIRVTKADKEREKKQNDDKDDILDALKISENNVTDKLEDVVEVDIRTKYAKLKELIESGQSKEEKAWKQLTERHDKADEALHKTQDAVQENREALQKAQDALRENGEALQKAQDAVQENGEALKKTQDMLRETREMLQKKQEILDEKITGQGQNICDELRKTFSDTDHKLDENEEELLRKLDLILSQMQESEKNGNTKLTECWENSQTALENYRKEMEDAAAEKYKRLLGLSLSFGVVNFLGIIALLVMNFMH